MARATFAVKTYMKRTKMIPSADPSYPGNPGYPGDPVHRLQLGTSPTRARGQDDVSLNRLPQITRADAAADGKVREQQST